MRTMMAVVLAMSVAGVARAAPQPVLMKGAELHGEIFSDPRAESVPETSETGTVTARDLVAHESADGCLQTGVYQTGRNRFTSSDPYPHDEFMYFLEGGVTLSSTDGTVTQVAAGDGVLLPKGWTGVWDSQGYRKIYVIYDCKPKAP
jgi:uncharacterized cupin superfamily protein